MQNCTEVFITDKTGKRYFKTLCSSSYVEPELRNLSRKLSEAKRHPTAYSFLDIASAQIVQVPVIIDCGRRNPG